MTDNYKGASLFNDVENKKLQAWNRVATLFNLTSEYGEQEGSNYSAHFSDEDKEAMKATLRLVKEVGYTQARSIANGNVQ